MPGPLVRVEVLPRDRLVACVVPDNLDELVRVIESLGQCEWATPQSFAKRATWALELLRSLRNVSTRCRRTSWHDYTKLHRPDTPVIYVQCDGGILPVGAGSPT